MNKLVFTVITLVSFTHINAAEEFQNHQNTQTNEQLPTAVAPAAYSIKPNNVPDDLKPYIIGSGITGNVIVGFPDNETYTALRHLLRDKPYISYIVLSTSSLLHVSPTE